MTEKLAFILRRFSKHRLRITFTDGEIFVVQNVSEVEREDPGMWKWSAEVLVTENLPAERQKFFRPGSGVDFDAADIRAIVDETDSRSLYSSE